MDDPLLYRIQEEPKLLESMNSGRKSLQASQTQLLRQASLN